MVSCGGSSAPSAAAPRSPTYVEPGSFMQSYPPAPVPPPGPAPAQPVAVAPWPAPDPLPVLPVAPASAPTTEPARDQKVDADDPRWAKMFKGGCELPDGTYVHHQKERDGTCGEIPEEILSYSNAIGWRTPPKCKGETSFSDDCSLSAKIKCATFDEVSLVRWSRDGMRAAGIEQLTFKRGGAILCTSTYDVTYVKQ